MCAKKRKNHKKLIHHDHPLTLNRFIASLSNAVIYANQHMRCCILWLPWWNNSTSSLYKMSLFLHGLSSWSFCSRQQVKCHLLDLPVLPDVPWFICGTHQHWCQHWWHTLNLYISLYQSQQRMVSWSQISKQAFLHFAYYSYVASTVCTVQPMVFNSLTAKSVLAGQKTIPP